MVKHIKLKQILPKKRMAIVRKKHRLCFTLHIITFTQRFTYRNEEKIRDDLAKYVVTISTRGTGR